LNPAFHNRLNTQLIGLEGRTARGGRDSINHAPGAHDDVANAAAGSLTLAVGVLSKAEEWARFGRECNIEPALGGLPQSAILYGARRGGGLI
jgi:hypothetical protein